ncbi:hypothetical protein H6P81_016310 [Aristolochia fimbriata]|uniref:Uncharacterized protein n=1 Tax=Aristolochia fimbriata TaxID=158543 RepID=A0AAV7EA15_ARIFI|nr:hypothetical protein H6P81_016310 [Aristolochia fimbriata]
MVPCAAEAPAGRYSVRTCRGLPHGTTMIVVVPESIPGGSTYWTRLRLPSAWFGVGTLSCVIVVCEGPLKQGRCNPFFSGSNLLRPRRRIISIMDSKNAPPLQWSSSYSVGKAYRLTNPGSSKDIYVSLTRHKLLHSSTHDASGLSFPYPLRDRIYDKEVSLGPIFDGIRAAELFPHYYEWVLAMKVSTSPWDFSNPEGKKLLPLSCRYLFEAFYHIQKNHNSSASTVSRSGWVSVWFHPKNSDLVLVTEQLTRWHQTLGETSISRTQV